MKYLIVGLGNIGYEYENTRHNIGFRVLDALAKASNLVFTDGRYGATCELRIKGRRAVLAAKGEYPAREFACRRRRFGLAVRHTALETQRQRCRPQRAETYLRDFGHTELRPVAIRDR